MAPARLSVAIVTYRTDPGLLERCVRTLGASVRRAQGAGLVDAAELFVIDNGPPQFPPSSPDALAAWPADLGEAHRLEGHGNVGYGRANNLVLDRLRSDFHVVMNPDVEVDAHALSAALAAFRDHPAVGLVAPAAVDASGSVHPLCKRYPSVWILFLRGMAPDAIRRRFAATLDHYEMRDVVRDAFVETIPLASGCFMAVRTALFRKLGGFDPRYFMYFEDYDLSLRLGRSAQLAYEPAARIVHHGGGAATKGWRHRFWFIRSALRFFASHGWKIA